MNRPKDIQLGDFIANSFNWYKITKENIDQIDIQEWCLRKDTPAEHIPNNCQFGAPQTFTYHKVSLLNSPHIKEFYTPHLYNEIYK